MSLQKSIARNLDDPPRLLGMSPVELCSCVISYAVLNMVLKGVPFYGLLSLGISLGTALMLRLVNLTRPPEHAVHSALALYRSRVTPVIPLDACDDGDRL